MKVLLTATAIIFVTVLYSCTATKPLNEPVQQKEFIYCVFDSLENYFISQIDSNTTEKPIGVIIDPKCKDCYLDSSCGMCWYSYWRVGLVYKSEYGSCSTILKVLNVSQRKMRIKGVLYPVAFLWVDDLFLRSSKELKKKRKDIEPLCYFPQKMVIVDFAKNYYYLIPGPLPNSVIRK